MIRTESKTLMKQLDWVESNVAWRWQVERLQSEVTTLRNILIDAGILVSTNDNSKETVYFINGETFITKKGKK